jgi:hypothetical protein
LHMPSSLDSFSPPCNTPYTSGLISFETSNKLDSPVVLPHGKNNFPS